MRRFLLGFLAILLMVPVFWLSPDPLQAAGPVCGVDGTTYESEEAALAADVEVSYEGACRVVTSEAGLEEEKVPINFAGLLIEIGTTEIPTTIIVEDNKSKTHYTVEVTEKTVLGQRAFGFTSLSDWIPGDQIRVIGQLNENTNTVTARVLVNLSFLPREFRGINGWITKIDKEKKQVTYTWMQKEHTVQVTDRTRIVAGLKNPASIDDLKIGDRIRGRTFASSSTEVPEAKIIVVLRRGKTLFMKIRTFIPRVELVRLNSTVVPTTIQVKILPTPTLRPNDVNNLIGTEGKLVTVNVTEDTILVRKYFGRTTLAEFTPGDVLHIVGRVNDDGTVDAKLIKNESIWMTHVFGHLGTVTKVDVDQGYFMMNWYPVRYLPRVKLKEIIREKQNSLQAEVMPMGLDQLPADWRSRVEKRVNKAKQRLQQAKQRWQRVRKMVIKRIKSERIKRSGVKLEDVIKKLPVKEMRVNVSEKTKIVMGGKEVTLAELSVGDRVLVRGVRHKSLPLIEAYKVVIFPTLPEIDDDPETALDEINEVVEEIVDEAGDVISEVETEIEEVLETVDESDGTTSGESGEAEFSS